MRRRTRIVGVGAVAALGLLTWGLWPASIPDPVVRGRPLSAWLDERRTPMAAGGITLSAEATAAVRSLGPAAVPALLAWLRQHDSAFERGVNAGWRTLGNRGSILRRQADQRARAALGFQALGPAGRSAWPAVIAFALHQSSNEEFSNVIYALTGADAEAARLLVPATSDADPIVRWGAMQALAGIHRAAEEVTLPTLERLRSDPDPVVAADAARMIPWMKGALKRKLPDLRHPDADVRIGAAESIGGHGRSAEEYLPDLRAAADDPDPGVRAAVAEAIRRVEGSGSSPAEGKPASPEAPGMIGRGAVPSERPARP